MAEENGPSVEAVRPSPPVHQVSSRDIKYTDEARMIEKSERLRRVA
jgi:hypothetical protein